MHGFELKVSRGDWFKDLRDMAKHDEARRLCDRVTLVAPKAAVQLRELPDWMGFWSIDGSGVFTVEKCGPVLPRQCLTRQDAACLARGVAVAEERRTRIL